MKPSQFFRIMLQVPLILASIALLTLFKKQWTKKNKPSIVSRKIIECMERIHPKAPQT